jgi:hypothetical protein
MITLISYIHAKKNRKIKKFIFYQLCLVLGFAIAYWLSDKLYMTVPEFMKKLGLGEIKTEDDFYSYMYLSLITQTTVGFGGILPDGGQMITTKSTILRYLVFLQLLSVIVMTGWTLA